MHCRTCTLSTVRGGVAAGAGCGAAPAAGRSSTLVIGSLRVRRGEALVRDRDQRDACDVRAQCAGAKRHRSEAVLREQR